MTRQVKVYKRKVARPQGERVCLLLRCVDKSEMDTRLDELRLWSATIAAHHQQLRQQDLPFVTDASDLGVTTRSVYPAHGHFRV